MRAKHGCHQCDSTRGGIMAMTRLRGEDTETCVETAGPFGIDLSMWCRSRNPEKRLLRSDIQYCGGGGPLRRVTHRTSAQERGCRRRSRTVRTNPGHQTPQSRIFLIDLDNESSKPVNPGAAEHQLPNPPGTQLDRVPTMVSLISIFLPGGNTSKSSPQQQTHV